MKSLRRAIARELLRTHFVLVLFALTVTGAARCIAQELPNIVIVYADDLGYGDLSVYNPDAAYQTPRLDLMAAEGMRFLDAHSPSTICSPSRYGLFSGELVCRTGRRSTAFEGPAGPSYLAPGQLTLAQMLKTKGYRTGVFGKWHLGLTWYDEAGKRLGGGFKNALLIDYEKSTPLEDGPNNRGFDESFITPNCPTTDPLYIYIENGMVREPASQRHRRDNLPNPGGKWRWDNDEGWMSPDYRFVDADLLFYERTVQFIRDHRKRFPDRPFFAVLSTQISHAPVLPAEEFRDATSAGPRGDFVRELDTLTGRLLDVLNELGIDRETLVVFNSDNGPETVHTDWMRKDHQHDAAGGFRGMKRDGWEGGHRVPMIARWPGRIPAGRVSSQLANTTDIFATLASIVGYELSDDDAVDSYDLLPAMLGTQEDDEPIRPYMLTQSFRGEFQLRQGPWKYLDHTGSGGNNYQRGVLKEYALPETAPEATGQLFNLDRDPGETTNLFFSEADKRNEMQKLLQSLVGSDGRTAPTSRKPIGIKNIPGIAAQNRPEKSSVGHPAQLLRSLAGTQDIATESVPPNIVFVMADDLGWADVAFHGGNAPTPRLDRLAEASLELRQHYVAPVCSPTRAGFLTGRCWSRFGITTPTNSLALPMDTVTLPRALKSSGYDTCLIGKWHLGSLPKWGPNHFGFDHSYGSLAGGISPWNHRYKKGPFTFTWHRNEILFEEPGHVTDLLTEEAVNWIRSRGSAPFFLYLPYTAIHLPLKEPPSWLQQVPGSISGEVARHYAASVMHLDHSVGRILDALDEKGVRDKTLFVFTSDNGGSTAENNDLKYPDDNCPSGRLTGNNAPLRGQKGDVYEGGTRVPTIVSWPGRIRPGKIETPVQIIDWMPTFCSLAGYRSDRDLKWDGVDLSGMLLKNASLADRAIYTAGPRLRASSLRSGPYKLVTHGEGDSRKLELFDVQNDPGERQDLSTQQPDRVQELLGELKQAATADRDSVAQSAPPGNSLITAITKQTLWRNRDGKGRTWFHPRVCMMPDGDGPPIALMNLQESCGSDYFGPVHWSISKDLGRTWSRLW